VNMSALHNGISGLAHSGIACSGTRCQYSVRGVTSPEEKHFNK